MNLKIFVMCRQYPGFVRVIKKKSQKSIRILKIGYMAIKKLGILFRSHKRSL